MNHVKDIPKSFDGIGAIGKRTMCTFRIIILGWFDNLCQQGAGVQILIIWIAGCWTLAFRFSGLRMLFLSVLWHVSYKGYFIHRTFNCIILRKMNAGQSVTRNSETESSILQTILTQTETSAKVSLLSSEAVLLCHFDQVNTFISVKLCISKFELISCIIYKSYVACYRCQIYKISILWSQ